MTEPDAEMEADAASADDDPSEADAGGSAHEPPATDGSHDRLVAEVAAYDEALAGDVGELVERVARVEGALEDSAARADELESKLKRARADFQNYKKRVKDRETEIRERATADLVERLLDVRDNLVRALEQDEGADIRDGIEATLASFDRVLADENVAAIEPEPSEAVDPERHEVVLRETDADAPPGTIERVYRPGYELAGSVLRPAQVTVSETDPDETE